MRLIRKKPKMNMRLLESLVHAYLDYIKSTGEELTCSEISETMRYSMCVAQGLETRGYSERIERLGVGAVEALKPILRENGADEYSLETKRGLLEACVISIESARNRVLEVTAV